MQLELIAVFFSGRSAGPRVDVGTSLFTCLGFASVSFKQHSSNETGSFWWKPLCSRLQSRKQNGNIHRWRNRGGGLVLHF